MDNHIFYFRLYLLERKNSKCHD
uniref:Uncharacterized protein n=1 Tax=Heterorhabditis bacteriophora TaxID=37862 RepID=A0A1I7WQP6_HETBA